MPGKFDINPKTNKEYGINRETGSMDDTYWSEVAEPGLKGRIGGGDNRNQPLDTSNVPSSLDFAKQLSSSEDLYLQALEKRMGEREKPLDIYSRLEQQVGLPDLRTTAKSLSKEIASTEDILDSIEGSVAGRTRQSLVTESQRQRIISSERLPHEQNLAKLATGLGRVGQQIGLASQGIAAKAGLALQGQQQELEPFQLRYQAIVQRNARYLSSFDSDKETELNSLIMNWQRGNTVSDMDWARMNELASAENKYIRELRLTASEAGASTSGSESASELLSLIGSQAADVIAFDRKKDSKSTGTESERSQAEAERSILMEARSGVTYTDLLLRYSEEVPVYKIREIYNLVSRYGPAQESGTQELEILKALADNDDNPF